MLHTLCCVVTDIDECELSFDNCSAYANCINMPGSFTCCCLSGYSGDGINCSGSVYMYINI